VFDGLALKYVVAPIDTESCGHDNPKCRECKKECFALCGKLEHCAAGRQGDGKVLGKPVSPPLFESDGALSASRNATLDSVDLSVDWSSAEDEYVPVLCLGSSVSPSAKAQDLPV